MFLGSPEISLATSPLNEIIDFTSVEIVGNLLIKRVRKGASVEKFVFKPIIVLLTGSVP